VVVVVIMAVGIDWLVDVVRGGGHDDGTDGDDCGNGGDDGGGCGGNVIVMVGMAVVSMLVLAIYR